MPSAYSAWQHSREYSLATSSTMSRRSSSASVRSPDASKCSGSMKAWQVAHDAFPPQVASTGNWLARSASSSVWSSSHSAERVSPFSSVTLILMLMCGVLLGRCG